MIASARPAPDRRRRRREWADNPAIPDRINACLASEGPGEAQLVAVGIGDVEEALAPCRITRRGLRAAAGGDKAPVGPVDDGAVEDQPAPPRPLPPGRLQCQVEEIVAGAKAGETGILAAVDDREPRNAVEPDGTRHVVRRQGDRA